MHIENLAPLFVVWPILFLPVVIFAALFLIGRRRRRKMERQDIEAQKRYWLNELA